MAIECMGILADNNIKIPQDISIIGFDDSILSSNSTPPLTTIAHPKQIMGESAARALLDLINKKRQWPYVNIYDPKLIERESCMKLMSK